MVIKLIGAMLAVAILTLISIIMIKAPQHSYINLPVSCPQSAQSEASTHLGGFPLRVYDYNECGIGMMVYKNVAFDFGFWFVVTLFPIVLLNKYRHR